MEVTSAASDLQKRIKSLQLKPLGFVPTMGALHQGHISLVRKTIDECPLAVVSIYVNPTQFNDKDDLKNYPRTTQSDLELLGSVLRKNDLVFTPGDKEVYPEEDNRVFHFGNLDKVMEALHRPGHFNGVAQVVSRLFDIVKPDNAYFGLKDFQQLAVIKELVKQTGSNVRIIGCPIVREPDGLAMSSRNRFLEKEIREKAPVIYKTILNASKMITERDIPEIKGYVRKTIEKEKGFSLGYFEIVDDSELIPVKGVKEMEFTKHYFGCIAVIAGKIRLIDNIEITVG